MIKILKTYSHINNKYYGKLGIVKHWKTFQMIVRSSGPKPPFPQNRSEVTLP